MQSAIIIMPIFGNRVVVGTANYKHIEEFNEDIKQREEALAQWNEEQKERRSKLVQLQAMIRRGSNTSSKDETVQEEQLESIDNCSVSDENNEVFKNDTEAQEPVEVVEKKDTCSGSRCLIQ